MRNKYLIGGGIILAAIIIAGIIIQKPDQGFNGTNANVTICSLNFSTGGLLTLARSQDYFSKEGLNVTLKQVPSGKIALEKMFNGECNIAVTAETPVVIYSFDMKNFSIFATISTSDNQNKIIARKDMGIQYPADLKQKRIGTQQGISAHFFLQVFLDKNGIPEDDVAIIFKNATDIEEALEKGEIDAYSHGEPYISRTAKLMGNRTVIFAEPGLSIVILGLVAPNDFIRHRPEVIDRLLLALIKTEEYSKNHPEETLKILSKQYGVDMSDLSAILNETELRVTLDASLIFALEDRARWMIEKNQTNVTSVPNYLDFIYMENLERVKPDAVTIIH